MGKDRGTEKYTIINDIQLIFHTMLTLYEGNKFSGERPGKNERYKKYEVRDKYYGTLVIPWWGNTGELPRCFPDFFRTVNVCTYE